MKANHENSEVDVKCIICDESMSYFPHQHEIDAIKEKARDDIRAEKNVPSA